MQWVFEPKVADMIFRRMLADDRVPVIFNEPIDLENGVSKAGGRITEIVSESGKKFSAKVFVDCSYEGDLMAEAGVTYTVGREANGEYGETMNGILPNDNEYQNTSPYIVDGDPDSGLLPFVEDSPLGAKGDADSRVQAYCFRFTLPPIPITVCPSPAPKTIIQNGMNRARGCCRRILRRDANSRRTACPTKRPIRTMRTLSA